MHFLNDHDSRILAPFSISIIFVIFLINIFYILLLGAREARDLSAVGLFFGLASHLVSLPVPIWLWGSMVITFLDIYYIVKLFFGFAGC